MSKNFHLSVGPIFGEQVRLSEGHSSAAKEKAKVFEVLGAIWAGQVTDLTGIFHIQYDSCQIKASLLAQPLKIRSWKENSDIFGKGL